MAVALVGGGDDDDVTTDDTATTTTTSTTSTSTTSTTAPPTTESVPPDPDDPIVRADGGLVIWPRDSRSFGSPDDAATTFAEEVLGDPDPIVEVTLDDDPDARVATATVVARGEAGVELDRAATELVLVVTDGRWDVVEATSDAVVIDEVTTPADDPLTRQVTGSGSGFEGTGLLTSTSWCDPEAVTTEIVALGAGPEPADFSAVVSVPDCPVVIIQLTDAPGADGATPALASVADEGSSPTG